MFYPRYYRIYKRMREKKIKASYLAAYVGISPAVLSKKLNGRTPWRLDECYAVMDALEVDRRELQKYFPAADVEIVINPEELEAFKCSQ